MNEQLQERVFSWVSQTAENIGEWTTKEVPLFINEYLLWKFWENAIGIGMYIAGFLICWGFWAILYKKLWGKFKESWEDNRDWIPVVTIFGGAALFVSFVVTLLAFPSENILTCLKIKVAPKIYLVEEAARIIKNK